MKTFIVKLTEAVAEAKTHGYLMDLVVDAGQSPWDLRDVEVFIDGETVGYSMWADADTIQWVPGSRIIAWRVGQRMKEEQGTASEYVKPKARDLSVSLTDMYERHADLARRRWER